MLNKLGVLTAAAVLAAAVAIAAPARADNQERVAAAAEIFERMATEEDAEPLRKTLKSAKAVLVFPSVWKAAFVVGAEGGNGVLLARNSNGDWSDPAFYTMGSGSVGFQIGVQDSEVLMAIMTDNGLDAIISNNAKLGVDAGIALGPIGGGIGGAVTTNFGGDIAVFTKNVGLFAGLSFEGSVVYERDDQEQEYYGSESATARAIVLERKFSNPGATGLKDVVAKYTN
ncbi:MAG: lipid-binding SYLF domain-containing protein [Alphaproteobacteria bacterium]|nr:lipid-binding SYLF domain-containing protein [Alphaproteobacteria bacterium]